MPKPVIAVDLDDIVLDFAPWFIAHHNSQYDTSVRYEDVFDFSNFDRVFQLPEHVMIDRLWKAFTEQHHTIPLVEHAQEALHKLEQDFSVHAITSRCESLAHETYMRLCQLGALHKLTKVHFTNGGKMTKHPQRTREKVAVCEEIGAILLLDDLPAHLEQVANKNIHALLMDRPWNQGFTAPGIVRTHNWHEVLAWVEKNL